MIWKEISRVVSLGVGSILIVQEGKEGRSSYFDVLTNETMCSRDEAERCSIVGAFLPQTFWIWMTPVNRPDSIFHCVGSCLPRKVLPMVKTTCACCPSFV